MHTTATEPRGFKWRVSLGERVAVNYYSQFARGSSMFFLIVIIMKCAGVKGEL